MSSPVVNGHGRSLEATDLSESTDRNREHGILELRARCPRNWRLPIRTALAKSAAKLRRGWSGMGSVALAGSDWRSEDCARKRMLKQRLARWWWNVRCLGYPREQRPASALELTRSSAVGAHDSLTINSQGQGGRRLDEFSAALRNNGSKCANGSFGNRRA